MSETTEPTTPTPSPANSPAVTPTESAPATTTGPTEPKPLTIPVKPAVPAGPTPAELIAKAKRPDGMVKLLYTVGNGLRQTGDLVLHDVETAIRLITGKKATVIGPDHPHFADKPGPVS